MTNQTYALGFDGYWRKPAINGLPKKSGIYVVYTCTYNDTAKTVDLKKFIYIGESGNVNERVANHEKWGKWESQLKSGEQICLSVTTVTTETARERAEAAMIFKHKPVCNTEYVNSFPFDTTTITTPGKNKHLQSQFTVKRT